MKLRIRGDSVRLRLTKGEVQRFLSEGSIEEVTHFPGREQTRLTYRVRAYADSSPVTCEFEHGNLTVWVPRTVLHRWATSEDVSIRAEQPIAEGGLLTILIEKDFERLTKSPGEPQDDTFANPRRAARE